ncbi:NUDIX hydrolase [Nocardia sp. NPDC051750]|uniref:NUDIX hydrolase n=1 Tax=Nocardia sp. NPDC051750 TaxID=3364325 RepID=UPI003790529F
MSNPATTRQRPALAVTVDLAAFTVRDGDLHVLLIERGRPPYTGQWALPGGHLEDGEDLDTAAARELAEETGVDLTGAHLEQVGAYGAPDRDPRRRVVTVCYLAVVPDAPEPAAGDDAAAAAWVPVGSILDGRAAVAFDHHRIIGDATERLRAKLEHSMIAAEFCPPEFTITELRRIYQAIWGHTLDQRNFHRKITGTPGAVIPTGNRTHGRGPGGRPAAQSGPVTGNSSATASNWRRR